jgi:hypothetical protein
MKLLRICRSALAALAGVLLLVGCSTEMKVVVEPTAEQANHPPKPIAQEIRVLQAWDPLPAGALLLARVRIRDGGLTIECSYQQVLLKAEEKARVLGGDLIRIVQLYEPDLASSCYRMDVDVYAIP